MKDKDTIKEVRVVPWDSKKQRSKSEIRRSKLPYIPLLIIGALFGLAINDSYKEKYQEVLGKNKNLTQLIEKDIKNLEREINNLKDITNIELMIFGRTEDTKKPVAYSVKLDKYIDYLNSVEQLYTTTDLEKMEAKEIFSQITLDKIILNPQIPLPRIPRSDN